MIEKRFGFGGVGREIGTWRRGLGRFLEPRSIAGWVRRKVHIHLGTGAGPIAAGERRVQLRIFGDGKPSSGSSPNLKRQIEKRNLHGLRELVQRKKSIGDFDVGVEVGLQQVVDVGLL